MTRENLERNYEEVSTAIEHCLANHLHMPALILMYSTIDTLAWVSADKNVRDQRGQFEAWVNEWLLPGSPFKCSATDFYAARCAILHTLTFEAKLTKSGAAREIMYCWGNASAEKQRLSIQRTGKRNAEAVHLNELFAGLRKGFSEFLRSAANHPLMKARLEKAASLHFDRIDVATVDEFLRKTEDW